jgi:hypothetical protein
MQLFCPACQAAFSGTSRCPRCGGLLLMPQEATALPPRARNTGYEPYTPSPANRVLVGTLLALGLYLALRQLATGWLMAANTDLDSWWLTFEGLQVVLGIQTAAAVVGAVMAGAGRPNGLVLGGLVGGLCGGLFLGAEVYSAGTQVFDLVLLIQPGVLFVAGAIAGVVGGRVWPTPPDVEKPIPLSPDKLSSIRFGMEEVIAPGRPIAWIRIIIGAIVMFVAITQADIFRNQAQKYSYGTLKVSSHGQGKFLSLQLATIAALVGATLAGAGTGSGIRHGVLAGALAGIGVVALGASSGEFVPPLQYWLGKLHMHGMEVRDPSVMFVVGMSVALVGAIGGWLGGTLFLPLAPAHLRDKKVRLAGD